MENHINGVYGDDKVKAGIIADAKCLSLMNNSNILSEISLLPEHLIVDQILPRLPVKTLIRFKSVSKFWHSTISSPNFANTHLNINISTSWSSLQYIILKYSHEFLLLPYNDERNNFENLVQIDFSLELDCRTRFVGSCDGLVCLYSYYHTHTDLDYPYDNIPYNEYPFFSICNPATREYHKIADHPTSPDYYVHANWFGCTSYVNYYKLVVQFEPDDCRTVGFHDLIRWYVFSLKTRKWKRICELERRLDYNYDTLSKIGMPVEDILYCSPYSLDCDNNLKRILGFDLINEQMKEFPWMDWLNVYEFVEFYGVNGSLELLCHHYAGNSSVDIWILKQHNDWSSWRKSISIRHGPMRPLSVSPTGKLLLKLFFKNHYKIVALSKDTEEQSQGDTYLCDKSFGGVGGYVESLISPFGTIKPTKEESHEA